MKKPIPQAGYSFVPLLAFLLFSYSCKKSPDQLAAPRFLLEVVSTSPQAEQQNSVYDNQLTATLNVAIDTASYLTSLQIFQEQEEVRGSVKIEDSLVLFEPETSLLPLHHYAAVLTVTEKASGALLLQHRWNFSTKPADEYQMTQRSSHVTGFNRDGTRTMQIGDHLYSFGGWTDNGVGRVYSDAYRSSGDLSVWEKRTDAPWHGRHIYGLAKLDGLTYVVGGDPWQPEFDVWSTANGEEWTLRSQSQLGNRTLYGCAAHNGFIYVVGGTGYNDVWRSRNGEKWERVAENLSFLKGENFAGSLVSFGGRLWLVCGGGDGWGGGGPRNEIWSSTDGKTWQSETAFPGSARYYTDVCVWDNKLWVIGGYNYTEGNIKSIWFMRPNGRWEEYSTPPEYIGRHATGVAVYNNSLAITCGNYHNDCWVIEKVK